MYISIFILYRKILILLPISDCYFLLHNSKCKLKKYEHIF